MKSKSRFSFGVADLLRTLTAATAHIRSQRGAPPYVWSGQVVSYDGTGKTVTVKVPYQEHINRYIDQFMRGDSLTLIWNTPRPGETDAVRYVEKYEIKSVLKHGYVLPVVFVSADHMERRMTVTVAIPSTALRILSGVHTGGWIKVTTSFDQPKETASILTIAASTEPQAPSEGSASPPVSPGSSPPAGH